MKDFRDIAVGDIMWQQPPFRFVDRLEYCDREVGRVSFTPSEKNLLMEDGKLTAAGLIEHMAQANAAREGYVAKYILHIDVGIGFIGQVRNFCLVRLPEAGERLDTTVEVRYAVFQVCLCDVTVRCADEIIATASLKTALKDE